MLINRFAQAAAVFPAVPVFDVPIPGSVSGSIPGGMASSTGLKADDRCPKLGFEHGENLRLLFSQVLQRES